MQSPCRLMVIGVFVAVSVGCSRYRAPALTVADARISERSEDGYVVSFEIDARNDNDVALPLRRVRYTLDLDGQRVFDGSRSPEATLRRRGTQRLTLPAAVSAGIGDGSGSGVAEYRLEGTLTYVTPGQIAELLFDTGVRVPKVRFQQTGSIDLAPN